MSNSAKSREKHGGNGFTLRVLSPREWAAPVRSLNLTGWCVPSDGSPLRALRVKIGWRTVTTSFFHERPDVIERFGAKPEQARCGFSLKVKVPPGRWRLRIAAKAGQGKFREIYKRRVIGKLLGGESSAVAGAEVPRRNDFSFWLDRPADWNNIGRELRLCGWCIHRSPEKLTGVRARVGGKVFRGTYGIQRSDLPHIFPDTPYAHCAGFAVTAKLPRRGGELLLEARDSAGQWHPFFEREIAPQRARIRDDGARLSDAELFDPNRRDVVSRFAFWLEPRANWSRLPKKQRVVGWCIALHGGAVEAVRARIGSRVWKARTGIRRPEVKAAYSKATEALQSGFSLVINPPLGRSLLQLEALSAGQWETFFAYQIQRPLWWRRGENRYGSTGRYEDWLRLYDKLDRRDGKAIRRHISEFTARPRFSILMPCYNSDARFLRAAITSVQRQFYDDWEICAVDDASPDERTWRTLQSAAKRDSRIKIQRRSQRGHISAASNDALGMATGEYVVLLDHDDELALHALYLAAVELNRQPDLQMLYGDEDKIDENGSRFAPYFKPEWNYDLLLAQNYAIHPLIVRTELARAAGGFASKFDGAQDHDLVLRCAERIDERQIKRIPWLLYHWRAISSSTADAVAAKPYALDARKRAVEGHLVRRGSRAVVVQEGQNQRVCYPEPAELVSIIIPTRDRGELLERCLKSVLEKTTYRNYEIILLDNGSTEPRARAVLEDAARDNKVRVIPADGPFNYSGLCNYGASLARGKVLLFLNNDVEVVAAEWLSELTALAMRGDAGAAGARLLFDDLRVQHAGVVLNPQRIGSYAGFKRQRSDPGYFSQLQLVREMSAVTAACMAVRAEVFKETGGFNEQDLGIAFNDVDFCLRLRERKLRVVWTPHAELIHHESSSRGLEDTAEKQARFGRELSYMRGRWGDVLANDPFYNPNLDLTDELYSLAFPPRVTPPWRARAKLSPQPNANAIAAAHSAAKEEFAFGFDEPVESIAFSRSPAVRGWLVNTTGASIHGIRVVTTKALRPRRTARARRKRQRPDIAAAFPHIPAAESSGFQVELPLRTGWNSIAFQAQDAGGRWRTFFEHGIRVLPLEFLRRARLNNVHARIAAVLRRANGRSREPAAQLAATPRLRRSPIDVAPGETRRIAILATSKSNLFIRELGELVAAGFRDLGYPTDCRYDELPRLDDAATLQIVLTPHEYYNLYLLEEKSLDLARKLTEDVVLLSTEQPNTTWAQQNKRWVPYARATADINVVGVAAYHAGGIPALHLGLGFHPSLAAPEQKKQSERAVEITFLGSLTPRRDAFFARHAAFFAEHQCHIRFVPLGFAKTEASRSYLAPERRNDLLANSKILLNLHYSDQRYFEWHRMLLGLANGCCIITEPCDGYAPLVPNQHFVMVEGESLIETIDYYLRHPEECAAIASAGKAFIETELRQEKLCAQFLGNYERLLDGQPTHPLAVADPAAAGLPADLSREVNPPDSGLARALVRDVCNMFRRRARAEEVNEPHSPEEQAPGVREEVIRRRTAYRERQCEQQAQRQRGNDVWTLFDNELYSVTCAPELSVVVTLFNYARFIEECLGSVAHSQIEARLEVIIVDDGSNDDSLARARRIQTRFPHAVRVVHKHFNTGLADARNIGIEFARAPYIFILDADNLVTPRALALLLKTMQTEDYAAAFSLLCRFREPARTGIGLLSYYDWDPEILVQSPYIDAMAMFRRDVLLGLGGYDGTLSEIGWFGWEDYDMWLRFAQDDLPVAFVPNVLCLYRHHEASMIKTTNLFWPELIELFRKRYAALVSRYPARERLFGVKREQIVEEAAR
ncbi:MAG: glycosyltransferase [Verrucomicrobia bacterium]|nr:glycosyltransferase [Verrucomicrobiota bacterium]